MTTFSKMLFSYVATLLHIGCMITVSLLLTFKGIQLGNTIESNLLFLWLLIGACLAPVIIAAYAYQSQKADFLYVYGRTACIVLVGSGLTYWMLSGQLDSALRQLLQQ